MLVALVKNDLYVIVGIERKKDLAFRYELAVPAVIKKNVPTLDC